ncbi:MAG: daptide-type RiPP [Acidimicrobiales bacterium]
MKKGEQIVSTLTCDDQKILDALDFSIDELDALESPGFWSDFGRGFVVGVGVAGSVAGAVGLGIALT